jgi:hypothetical protein
MEGSDASNILNMQKFQRSNNINLLLRSIHIFTILLILKRLDFLDSSSVKLSSLIWCIVGCRIPSDDDFGEKYGTKITRKEMFMNPTLCFVHNLI